MGRPVVLSNGKLMVGLDEQGLVHDFYYPYVGLENLTTARSVHHSIGIWVDGTFSWVDRESWNIHVDFEEDALVSNIAAHHETLEISLTFRDFVDNGENAFCRLITVKNCGETKRDIRIFMHQVFQISNGGRGDTALFVPDENYILDFKGHCSLLIYGQQDGNKLFDQFAVGNYGVEGKEGTFRDAEDGELSGSAIEHGGVDSVIRFQKDMEPNQTSTIEYWIVASDSQFSAEKIHVSLLHDGLENRLEKTRRHWHKWLSISADQLNTIDKKYQTLTKKSLLVIKAHADKRGGIIASGDSSIFNYGRHYYNYFFPRDGCYAIWPLIRLGYQEEPKRFFEFCSEIISPNGYMLHKYQADRTIGSTWHPMLHSDHKEIPIQEDETAIVICMIAEYLKYTKDEEFVKKLYPKFVKPAVDFLSSFIDAQTGLPHASYDIWEEKFLTTTYSTAVVHQALLVGVQLAEMFDCRDDSHKWQEVAKTIQISAKIFFDLGTGTLRKGFLLDKNGSLKFDDTLDVSSMYGAMMFGLYDDTTDTFVQQSASVIEKQLLNSSPSGGSPRYMNDMYFRSEPAYSGNPWLVTTLWLAQYYIRCNNFDKARELIDWAMAQSLASGVLPEQINPENSAPTSVAPLVWSHAELINTILDMTMTQNPTK